MSAADPISLHSAMKAKRKRLVRTLGIVASSLMVLTVLTIFVLILRTERAHNDETCQFASLSQREVGSTLVLEERRQCLPEMEERRYLLRRAGKADFELARKRLPTPLFAADRYQWTLREDAAHRVVVRMDVDGKLSGEFFEEDTRQ